VLLTFFAASGLAIGARTGHIRPSTSVSGACCALLSQGARGSRSDERPVDWFAEEQRARWSQHVCGEHDMLNDRVNVS
jgi:hypothetical protein